MLHVEPYNLHVKFIRWQNESSFHDPGLKKKKKKKKNKNKKNEEEEKEEEEEEEEEQEQEEGEDEEITHCYVQCSVVKCTPICWNGVLLCSNP